MKERNEKFNSLRSASWMKTRL